MIKHTHESEAQLVRSVGWLLIVCSVGVMLGRILAVQADHGRTLFLSANDRSRWCTIRALVDHGTYAIDQVIANPDTGQLDRDWYTIDLVRHRGSDRREHYYSSKPTLLPTLLAGVYWVLQLLTGATLADNPFYVGRWILILANVVPLVLYFWLLSRCVQQYGRTAWGSVYVLFCAAWGTYLTTFAVTLNNHVPAAVCALVAVYAALRIWPAERPAWAYFVLAGCFSALGAANELPALSLLAALACGLLYKSPQRTLLAFVPAVAVVAAGFFGTNYLAHGSFRPAYAHRQDGPLLAQLEPLRGPLPDGPIGDHLRSLIQQAEHPQLPDLSPATTVTLAGRSDASRAPGSQTQQQRWVLWDPDGADRLVLLVSPGQAEPVQVLAWDNWYEYPGSYWLPGRRRGIDRGEASRWNYALHLLVGHHGLFSLTPIWLLSALGAGLWLRGSQQRRTAPGDERVGSDRSGLAALAATTVVISLVCIGFYIARPLVDRNYGGIASGPRWLFWLTPLWLLCLIPAADRLAAYRVTRALALALLGLSVLSASYALLDPWVHPWIYQYWQYLEGQG